MPCVLHGLSGVALGAPYTIVYEQPYGNESRRIPYGSEFELVEIGRLFARVKVDGISGYIPLGQCMEKKNFESYLKSVKRYGRNYKFCTPSVNRIIAIYDENISKVLKYVLPGRVLPVLGVGEKFYRVKYMKMDGYVLRDETTIFGYSELREHMKVVPWNEQIKSVKIRIIPGENRVFQFFLALLDYFDVELKSGVVEEKLRYVDEELTLKDFAELSNKIGLFGKVEGPVWSFARVRELFSKGNIVLFKLRMNEEYGYFILISIGDKIIKLLDIFKLSIKQMEIYDFMNLLYDSLKVVVIKSRKSKL